MASILLVNGTDNLLLTNGTDNVLLENEDIEVPSSIVVVSGYSSIKIEKIPGRTSFFSNQSTGPGDLNEPKGTDFFSNQSTGPGDLNEPKGTSYFSNQYTTNIGSATLSGVGEITINTNEVFGTLSNNFLFTSSAEGTTHSFGTAENNFTFNAFAGGNVNGQPPQDVQYGSYIGDGSLEPFKFNNNKIPAATPISTVGVGQNGNSACYDGNGEVLYVSPSGTSLNVYRSNCGYRLFGYVSNCCDYVTTITSDLEFSSASTWIGKINGTFYINHGGNRTGGRGTGHWVWRDTSVAKNGSGPWVLHSTVVEGQGRHDEAMGRIGEIVVTPQGRWFSSTYYPSSTFTFLAPRMGVRSSDDGGLTWTQRLNLGWHIVGGFFTNGQTRNFPYFNGHWYWGGSGNVDAGKHYKSPNGVDWINLGSLGTGNSQGLYPAASTQDDFYYYSGYGTGVAGASPIYRVDDGWTYEQLGSGATFTALYNFSAMGLSGGANFSPLFCNVGPELDPVWVMCNQSKVLRITATGGWQVGRVGVG